MLLSIFSAYTRDLDRLLQYQ